MEIKYTSDGKYTVKSGKTIIAKSYLGQNGYEVRILQGMDRNKTQAKIFADCPEFSRNNNMNPNIRLNLF